MPDFTSIHAIGHFILTLEEVVAIVVPQGEGTNHVIFVSGRFDFEVIQYTLCLVTPDQNIRQSVQPLLCRIYDVHNARLWPTIAIASAGRLGNGVKSGK